MHTPNVVSAWALETHDALDAAARALGLDQRALAALTLVGGHGGCSIDWLRRRVGITHSGAVRLVDRLAAAGLLVRRPAGRGVELGLTPKGNRVLERWSAERARAVEGALDGLDPSERDALVTLLATALERCTRPRERADATCRLCEWPACGPDCPVDRSVAAA